MPRPHKSRQIAVSPIHKEFKPAGIPLRNLEIIDLTMDELEAIRLADLEGFYQVAISKRMGISRQTAARILESARKKVAEALVEGKALQIGGGNVVITEDEGGYCYRCGGQFRGRGRNRRFREQRQRSPQTDECTCPEPEDDSE